MNLKEKISIYYTNLTPTEKRICTLIMKDPSIIIEHNIIEAGELCQTSKSAMLRFAKKLEYRGYSEFKYSVEEYYKNENVDNVENTHNTILSRISNNYALTINQIGNSPYDEQLQELAQLLDEYPYVKSLGIGNSSFCASQLVYSLYSYNKFFEAITDEPQFRYLNNCLSKDYLLIIFSVSGSNTYLDLLKTAKRKGAYTVLITMNNDTSLKNYANMVYYLPSTVEPRSQTTVLKQFDNRTTLHFFAEIISYYYGLYSERK